MRVVGAAGVPPRSPSADRSTHVPAAGSVGLGGSDGCPLPKHSCLNWVTVSCQEGCAPPWEGMQLLATKDCLTRRHKGWALPPCEKNSVGQLWPRASCGARVILVCRRTFPQVAFLSCQFLLSQFFFLLRVFPQQISSTRILVSGTASEEANLRQCN